MKPRLKRIATNSLYASLTLLVPIATIILVAVAQGYRFDFEKRQVVTSGLAVVESRPRGSAIEVDGESVNKSTPERLVLPAGDYELVLRREGYRIWRKTVRLIPSQVTSIRYPLLLLNTINTVEHTTVPALAHFTQSYDKKLIAFSSVEGTNVSVRVLESERRTTPRTVYALPAELMQKNATIQRLFWAHDSEHLLAEIKTNDGLVHIALDAVGSDQPVNISEALQLPLSDLRFSRKNWRELFWLSPQGLRRIDLAARTVSGVLADHVASYEVVENGVFFLRNDGTKASIFQLGRDNNAREMVTGLDPRAAYHNLRYLSYENAEFVTVVNASTQAVTLYQITTTDENLTQTFAGAVSEMTISPSGRFILMRHGGNFATYDLEESRLYTFSLPYRTLSNLIWYDEYHLLGVGDGSAVLFEFDGGNIEAIVGALNDFPVFAEPGGKSVYSVTRSSVSDQTVIQVSRIQE